MQEKERHADSVDPEVVRALEEMQARQKVEAFALQHRATLGEGNVLDAIAALKQRHAEHFAEIERRFHAQRIEEEEASRSHPPAQHEATEEVEDVGDPVAEAEATDDVEEEEKEPDAREEEEQAERAANVEPRRSSRSTRRRHAPPQRADSGSASPASSTSPRSRRRSRSPPLSARSDLTAYTSSTTRHFSPSSTSRSSHSTTITPRKASHSDGLQIHRPHPDNLQDSLETKQEDLAIHHRPASPHLIPSIHSPTSPAPRRLAPSRPSQRPATAGPFRISARDAYEKWGRPIAPRPPSPPTSPFRAKDLPTHILTPQYDALMQSRDQRSKERRRVERERLYGSIQPFEFAMSRELQRRRRQEKGGEEGEEEKEEDGWEGKGQRSESSEVDVKSSNERHVAFGLTTSGSPAPPRPSTAPTSADGRFVARDVPYACSVELLESVLKRVEERRAEVRRRRSAYLTSIAALPPRMQRHTDAQRAAEHLRITTVQRHSHLARLQRQQRWAESERAADEGHPLIPDFARLQSDFAAELQRRKGEQRPRTQPQAFRFRHTERVMERHRGRRQEREEERVREEGRRREEGEEERRRREVRRRRVAERFLGASGGVRKSVVTREEGEGELDWGGRRGEGGRVREELRAALAGHWSVQEQTAARIKRQAEEGRRALKEAEERWAEEVRRMREKVQSRPLLLHGHVRKEREREAQRKAVLSDIQRTLERAGVVDQREYFAAEELQELQDGGQER